MYKSRRYGRDGCRKLIDTGWFYPLCLLVAVLVFTSSGYAQLSSSSYTLVTGTFVATGGISTSSATSVVASVPTTISGVTSSTSYNVSSGVVGVSYSLLNAKYAGGPVQSVPAVEHLLKVAYAGETGVATGQLSYRYGGGTAFTTVAMSQGTGDTLEYNCPENLFSIRGLEYYIQVFRGASLSMVGTPSAPYVFRVTLTNDQARSDHLGESTYNIVGVPLAISGGNTVQNVFEDDLGTYNREVWRLGRYSAATGEVVEYPDAPAVVPGRGYWIITRADADFGATGASVVPNRTYNGNRYLAIPLDNGWNQIANPFAFPVSMIEVVLNDNGVMTTDPTGVIEPVGHYYNGSAYFDQVTFDPWDGVFLFAEKAGVELWVRYHAAGSAKPVADGLRLARPAPMWQVELTMETADRGDYGNYIGVCADAAEGADYNDYSEPPMAPEGIMLAYKLPDSSERLRRNDFRPEFHDGAIWEVVFSEGQNRVVRANGLESIPEGMEAWLILTDADKIRLEEGKKITLPSDVFSAQLLIGTASYIGSEVGAMLPKEFALGQNFPNPFNPSTSIRFALPAAAHVELKVYNLLGQRVATVVDADMEAGNHTVVWEGRTDGGASVASGVYFYRLAAGAFSETKKMLLLK